MRLEVFAMHSPLKMAKNGMTIYKYIELDVGVRKYTNIIAPVPNMENFNTL